jgi:hypothetical protein
VKTDGQYRSGVHIEFDVPADPAYPGRVAGVLSGVQLRKYGYIGAVLVVLGAVGLALARAFDPVDRVTPLFVAMVVAGVLSLLFPQWVRFNARRRSSGYAVEGGYDITDENILMRSGAESGGIAWDGVTRVADTPEFWIVYVGRQPATVIPRAFMSPAEAETLRAFLAERGLL